MKRKIFGFTRSTLTLALLSLTVTTGCETEPKPAAKSSFENILDAAKDGKVDDVRYFVEQGMFVDIKGVGDWTPLHFALMSNPDVKVVEYLITQWADVNAVNVLGQTPFDLARTVEKKNLLLDAGGKPGKSILHQLR